MLLGDGEGVVGQNLVLGGVAGSKAAVSLRAGVGRGAAGNVPLVRPVAVDVGADASRSSTGLTVLAPETSALVGEDETWVAMLVEGQSPQ
jgi:hypothetical protein